jgi:hypothetical protein
MLNTRNVITAVLVIAVISLVGVVIELAQPPDSGGLGRDSYGTRAHGLRALYEVLEELDLPAGRSLVPPSASLRTDACLVLLAPDPGMVRMEPGHLHTTAQWVREGGRAMVAPSRPMAFATSSSPLDEFGAETSALAALGLPEVAVTSGAVSEDGEVDGAEGYEDEEEDEEEGLQDRDWESGPPPWAALREPAAAYRTVSVSADGELAFLGEAVSSLSVREEDVQVIAPSSEPAPEGRVFFRDEDGVERDLVALYPLGEGELVVVSDPALFLNRSIAEADNAVLAVHLLGRLGGRAVFDEFYHGLTIRGNPVWLVTRHPYGLFVALLLAATALWVWREWVRLGPPAPAGPFRRRSIGEYVDAMARLFHRSGHWRFILGEVKGGVLWALRKRLHLGPGRESVEGMAQALGRRDAEAAERLRSAAGRVDALLSRKREPNLNATVQAAREIARCL